MPELNHLSLMRQFWLEENPLSLSYRQESLKKLYRIIKNRQDDIAQALWQDLHKGSVESYATEIGFVLQDISHTLKHLRSWSKPKKVATPLSQFPAKSYIYAESYGLVLIISPWNYPFQLTIAPLIAAVAAGNCVAVKPSPLAKATAQIIDEILTQAFDNRHVCAFLGENSLTIDLLKEHFDYIFYTGSTSFGKTVMEMAAQNLTPVTLELGGKSPCIILPDADLKLSARKIIFGKFLNNGQTCVAPDYILVPAVLKKDLLRELQTTLKAFYPNYDKLACIISESHLKRLIKLLENEKIVCGGNYDFAQRFLEPTIIDEVSFLSPIMQEEIFGGILPVISYDNWQDTLQYLKSKPKALAAYIFTQDQAVAQEIIDKLSFGGGCVNDTIMHLVNPHLPFGGVGLSGMGAYHGKAGFDTFSHYKSVLKRRRKWEIANIYPPYTKRTMKMLKRFIR